MSGIEQAVTSLFSAFNRRAVDEVTALCTADVRFDAAGSGFGEREVAYSGREGMRDYLHDVASVWDEFLITPRRIVSQGEEALVLGRVFARGRRVGLRDLPIAWRLVARRGRFASIRLYEDQLAAIRDWQRTGRI
jgi:ketosteroid isomerase-like protein